MHIESPTKRALKSIEMDPSGDELRAAKSCELHVHIGGCFSVDDLIHLAGPFADEVDWSLYTQAYREAFGIETTPAAWIRGAHTGDESSKRHLHDHYVYTEADGADFSRFMAKFNLAIATLRHHHRTGSYEDCVERVIDRHRLQGIEYVELRAMPPGGTEDPYGFLDFHSTNARVVAAACRPGFVARYVPSIPRWEPLVAYSMLHQWLLAEPELAKVVVGLDFCHFEEGFPPCTTRDFFHRFVEDEHGEARAPLDVLYHVGEIYFDKSLESSVRWCHEVAELGAKRLGHCTALGLDPEVAVTRRPQAHELEPVSERLHQIDYDLRLKSKLENAGITVDDQALKGEREQLRSKPADAAIRRPYDEERLEQVRRRQDFVLRELTHRGVVIESCPSSNMRLGSVPGVAEHPVHRFLASDVPLVIGADDPGIFDSPLAAEVEWTAATSSLSRQQLARRLGDPRRFACGMTP